MSNNQQTLSDLQPIAQKVIHEAMSSKSEADRFLQNPSQAFLDAGFPLPKGHIEQFNLSLESIGGDVLEKVRQISVGEAPGNLEELIEASVFSCIICRICTFPLGIAIVAIGAASLAALTVEDAIVVALAGFLAVPAATALSFLQGLGAAVLAGIDVVIFSICDWINLC